MSEENTNPMPADLLNQILAELKRTNARFDRFESRFEKFEKRFEELEAKVESTKNTRPIWENILLRLDKIEADLVDF